MLRTVIWSGIRQVWKEEKCMEGFGEETWRKATTWKVEDYIGRDCTG